MRYLYYVMTVVISAAFVAVVIFLYRNFYLTLAGAREVESLVSRVSTVSFDVKKVEDAARALQRKHSDEPPVISHDPFRARQ